MLDRLRTASPAGICLFAGCAGAFYVLAVSATTCNEGAMYAHEKVAVACLFISPMLLGIGSVAKAGFVGRGLSRPSVRIFAGFTGLVVGLGVWLFATFVLLGLLWSPISCAYS